VGESAGPESASQLLRAVIAEVIGGLAEVEVLEPSPGWLACVRLRGPEGRVCVLLTDGERHEVQLAQPQVGVFIVSDEVAPTLSMLAHGSTSWVGTRCYASVACSVRRTRSFSRPRMVSGALARRRSRAPR